jgi:hypothetical protein
MALAALLATMSVAAGAAEGPAPPIPEDEEYAVFAAVLYPHQPEIPGAVTDEARFLAEYRTRVRLGTLASYYNIREETMPGVPLKPGDAPSGPDPTVIADFTAKNVATYRIDHEKLMRLLPTHRVRLHSDREFQGWAAYRPTPDWGASGITFLSRVGFNPGRTQAVVYVHHQGNPRMGVGYVVFLEKSASTGRWLLSRTLMTTIS